MRHGSVIILFCVGTFVTGSSQCLGQIVSLQNGFDDTAIVVVVQAEGSGEPARLRIGAGGTARVDLVSPGNFSVMVIPEDEPTTGYGLGILDLRKLSAEMGGAPFVLRGEFANLYCLRCEKHHQVRALVHMDLKGRRGEPFRASATRAEYGYSLMPREPGPPPPPPPFPPGRR